jgi:hypothetical protein
MSRTCGLPFSALSAIRAWSKRRGKLRQLLYGVTTVLYLRSLPDAEARVIAGSDVYNQKISVTRPRV